MSLKLMNRSIVLKHRGYSLIEAMIALFIFSIGLLGIFATQAASLRDNRDALWQSQAVWASYDIIDRMRANEAGVDTNEYDDADTSGATAPNPDCKSASTECNAAEVADMDIYEWSLNVQSLPSGRGMITRNGTQYRIQVMWDQAGNGATGTDCDPTDDNDLVCVDMVVEL